MGEEGEGRVGCDGGGRGEERGRRRGVEEGKGSSSVASRVMVCHRHITLQAYVQLPALSPSSLQQ